MEAAVASRERVVRAPHPRARALLRLAGDERLVQRIRVGDERAFAVVYDRHHAAVLSVCRHLLGSREEAEDALQATFLSAHRNLLTHDRPVALRAWLCAIARNRCMSVLRARREQPGIPDGHEPAVEGLASEVERREDLRALLRDIAALPDQQRLALVLAEVGQLSHAEIAQVTGVPTKKVKALVFQARDALIARRDARELPCRDVREQLATLTGGALRRRQLRLHVRQCDGCRAYRESVRRQRAALAVLLPVAPTAGLKRATLASVVGGGGGAAATGTLVSVTAAKIAVGVALAGGAVGGGALGVEALRGGAPPAADAAKAAPSTPGTVGDASASSGGPAATAGGRERLASGTGHGHGKHAGAGQGHRRHGGAAHGRRRHGAAHRNGKHGGATHARGKHADAAHGNRKHAGTAHPGAARRARGHARASESGAAHAREVHHPRGPAAGTGGKPHARAPATHSAESSHAAKPAKPAPAASTSTSAQETRLGGRQEGVQLSHPPNPRGRIAFQPTETN